MGKALQEREQKPLKWLEKDCLPGLENIYQMKLEEKRLLIGGYSLSGLFCNVGFYELGIFTGAAACSASFWFPRLDGIYETAYGTQEEQNLLEPWNQGREDQKSRHGNSRGGCQRHVSAAV